MAYVYQVRSVVLGELKPQKMNMLTSDIWKTQAHFFLFLA